MQVVGHQMTDTLYPRFLRAVVEQARIMVFSSNAGLTVRVWLQMVACFTLESGQ